MLAMRPACALARFSFVMSTHAKAQHNIKRSGPILRRDLVPFYTAIDTVYKRFRHWVKSDVFKRIFDAVSNDPDMEYVMIDGTIVKVHRHGQGAKGGLKARLSGALAVELPPKSWL